MTALRAFVIGGAGFIGSHLVDALVRRGPVTVFDDLSVGSRERIAGPLGDGTATLVVGDALDSEALRDAMQGHDVVFHLAANPEARWGLERPALDLEQGTVVTQRVLDAMRVSGVPRFVLASSGTVYGEAPSACGEMDLGHLPISLYGASKLACEALASAYAECFDLRGTVLRFGNVVGPRGTHGAALDFLRKLARDGRELEVLGDGRQAKPYLHVSECVEGILFALDHQSARFDVWNLAPTGATNVRHIAELCVRASPFPDAALRFTGGDRGWRGDVPRSLLCPDKLAALGFRVTMSSDEAVARAVEELAEEVFGGAVEPT